MHSNTGQTRIKNYFLVASIISFVISTFEISPLIIFYLKGWVYPVEVNILNLGNGISLVLLHVLLFVSNVISFIINYSVLKPFSKEATNISYVVAIKLIGSIIALFLISVFFNLFSNLPINVIIPANIFRSIIVSTVTISYTYYMRLSFQKETFELENEVLKKEKIKSQFETLKNELSPHFLFNSLSVLQGLIRKDTEIANMYVNHLSMLLRYALESNNKKFIMLSEELQLAKSYIFLMKMRYGKNLEIETNLPSEYELHLILPLTIQSLIENAIKHNEASKRNPLKIVISINEEGYLSVSNNLQKRLTSEPSLGVGLPNLSKRFQLLFGKDINVSQDEKQFKVEIPLLKE